MSNYALGDQSNPDISPEENSLELTEQEQKKLCGKLDKLFTEALGHYEEPFRRMWLLDSIDKGHLWKALRSKFPKYQVLPDTNHVARIKQNLLASLYTVAKSASILPTAKDDVPIVEQLNVLMENIWDTADAPYVMYEAGERAALCNLGITQVGYTDDFSAPGEVVPENVVFENVDPMRFMRDPFSTKLENAGWCCRWDPFDESFFKNSDRYKDAFKRLERENKLGISTFAQGRTKYDDRPFNAAQKTYNLVRFWKREEYNGKTILSEYHTIDNHVIVYYKRDIKPSKYPFAELYCNLPTDSLVGTSEPDKILSNSVAYNVMKSMAFTLEYKRFRPAKFVSQLSGLNVHSFSKYGDDPDKAFLVKGPAKDAVHYQETQQPSNTLPPMLDQVQYDIQDVTGVDGRYTGRDTGSIITTGGTEEMLDRVTLIDAPKILNYERYCRDLTQLVLLNLAEFSPTRTYLIEKPDAVGGQSTWEELEVDFNELFGGDSDKIMTMFRYSISISSELPKNKQRIMAFANTMMEKQMQYQNEGGGQTVDLITAEEWLQMQDIPHKEYMLKRMGVQKQKDYVESTAKTLAEFDELLLQGVPPEQALMQAAEGARARDTGQKETPLQGLMGTEPAVAPDMSGQMVPPADVAAASPEAAAMGMGAPLE